MTSALLALLLTSAPAADGVRLRLFTPAWRMIGNQKPQDIARKRAHEPRRFHRVRA